MSGIPVDLLVDIDGPQDRFTNSTCFKNFDNDDPFELCSFPNRTEKDLGAELGFVLEKSIRISSQSNCHISTSGTPNNSSKLDLGILVNLDDSPDKKLTTSIAAQNFIASSRESDSIFTHTPSNPFELAWDVIEQEALTLANHIQDDREKRISPRKMVDMAMRQSRDSLLLSDQDDDRDDAILINSSPEMEYKRTPKVTKPQPHCRARSSVPSSPVIAKSHITPSRLRPSLGPISPLLKAVKSIAPSPAKLAAPKNTFKLPLLRPSVTPGANNVRPSVTPGPNNVRPSVTPGPNNGASSKQATKPAPLKAIYNCSQAPSSTSSSAKPQAIKSVSETPLRRSIGPSFSLQPAATSTPSFHSKLRAPLTRTESDVVQSHQPVSKKPEFQRQGSLRYAPKRNSLNFTPTTTSANANKKPPFARVIPKGRENLAP